MNPWPPRIQRPIFILLFLGGAALLAFLILRAQDGEPTRPAILLDWTTDDADDASQPFSLDSDHDGLSDLDENYLWGSDPFNPTTGGSGIPDGWLARYGFDPTRPAWGQHAIALPDDYPEPLRQAAPGNETTTLLDVYRLGRPPTWSEERDGPWHNALDPTRSTTPDGISIAWLIQRGLDPRDAAVGSQRIDDQTILENYRQGTDPRQSDTDADGLSDQAEAQLHGTNPLRASTSGTGIPDGWMVHVGLDPLDMDVPHKSLQGKGMSVLDVYRYNEFRFGTDAAKTGAGLDPRKTSHLQLRLPDGWLVDHGLDPLDPTIESKTLRRASEFPDARHLESAFASPILPDYLLSVLDAYNHGRPPGWKESEHGPWRGGLDPSDADPDHDGLPDTVELRGWFVNRTVGTGSAPVTRREVVQSDPKARDSDGDGLSDGEEYRGAVAVGATTRRFHPSDPTRSDTAFSGLSDSAKVLGVEWNGTRYEFFTDLAENEQRARLEPNMSDSDLDGLRDGDELQIWASMSASEPGAYGSHYPQGGYASSMDWFPRLPILREKGIQADAAYVQHALRPDGDADLDGLVNLFDPDSDNDNLLDGWEVHPGQLAFSEFASPFPRTPTDPANADTDADQLPDAWELTYGAFLPGSGRWTLDPTRLQSDGVTADGDANLDLDEISWYSYRRVGTELLPTRHRFEFKNLAEFQSGTDPRRADQNADGIPEAWPFFWGTIYPVLTQSHTATPDLDPGEVRPDPDWVAALSARLNIGNPQLAAGSKSPGGEAYWRMDATAPALASERVERILRVEEFTDPRTARSLTVSTIEGRFVLTFLDEARLGTNPYLDDTDGDGLPDAWEILHGPCLAGSSSSSPDPTRPDASDDPDADKLSNLQEYLTLRSAAAFGTDPCQADTDLGGIEDAKEQALRLNPLRASDDASTLGGGTTDSDHDGLRDGDEILRGTNPESVDTDRDGLLDGGNLAFIAGPSGALPPAAAELVRRGIQHTRETHDGSETWTFRGETPLAANPTASSSADDGIPDGWKAAHGLPVAQEFPQHRIRYETGRPEWWQESLYGVWWWGTPPSSPPSAFGHDNDLDGLDDLNGEDPVPGGRHSCCLTGPHPLLAQDADEAWLAGQAYGEHAGDPLRARAEWANADYDGDGILDRDDRAPTKTLIQSLEQPPGRRIPSGGILLKGEAHPFLVRGQVLLECATSFSCATNPGLKNRVVTLEFMDSTNAPLGAGLTGPDGSFAVTACICHEHSFSIQAPGAVFQSKTSGTATWTYQASGVPSGPNNLTASTFATTATFWDDLLLDDGHPQKLTIRGAADGQATTTNSTAASTSNPLDLVVGAPTRILISLPPHVGWTPGDRVLPVRLTLQDATGRPIHGERLTLTWRETTIVSPSTDEDGQTQASFPIPFTAEGQSSVALSFPGNPPHLQPSTATSNPVIIQGPSRLDFNGLPNRIHGGEPLVVTGRILGRNAPVPGAPVEAILTLLGSATLVVAQGVSSGQGEFSLSLTVPPGFIGGANLVVTYEGDELHAATSTTLALDVLASSALEVQSTPPTASAGQTVHVKGRLLVGGTVPTVAHRVILELAGATLNDTQTNGGQFQLNASIPLDLQPGTRSLAVRHPEQFGAAPSLVERDILIMQSTRLAASLALAPRGQLVHLAGRLSDASGNGLGGQEIHVTWRQETIDRPITDASGRFRTPWMVPSDLRLGPQLLTATYSGSDDGLYQSTTAAIHPKVIDSPSIEIQNEPTQQPRDAIVIRGTIRSPDRTPIPAVNLEVRLGTRVLGNAESTSRGEWTLRFSLPPSIPAGRYDFAVLAPANDTLAAAAINATLDVQAQTEIHASLPSALAIGGEVSFPIIVQERGGPAVSQSDIIWRLDGYEGRTSPGDPEYRIAFKVPPELKPGPHRLILEYVGDTYRAPSQSEPTILAAAIAHLDILDLPTRIQQGETASIRLRLLDSEARPVPDETVALSWQGAAAPFLTKTNADGEALFPVRGEGVGNLVLVARYAGNDVLAPASAIQEVAIVEPVSPLRGNLWIYVAAPALAIALILAGLLWLRLRPLQGIRDALRGVAQDLVAADDISGSILLAYEKLSQSFRRFGYDEQESETPREFLTGLLEFFPTQAENIEGLSQLFEQARYGGIPMEQPDRDRALYYLRNLINDLHQFIRDLHWRTLLGGSYT